METQLTARQKDEYNTYRGIGATPQEALDMVLKQPELSKADQYIAEGAVNRRKNQEAFKKPVTNFTIGLGKGTAEVARNLAGTLQDIGQFSLDNTVGKIVGGKAGGFDVLEGDTPEILQPSNDIQKVGAFAAELGSFIAPQTKITTATKLLQASLAGKAGLAVRTGAEALGQGALAYGITRDPNAAILGAGFGAAGVPLQAGAGAVKNIFRPKILDEVADVVTPSGVSLDKEVLKEASSKAFDKKQSVLLSSLAGADKEQTKKMFEKALKQQIDVFDDEIYPIDIAGQSFVNRIKNFDTIESSLGKAVDTAAKSLKGKTFSVKSIKDKADELIQETGIRVDSTGDNIKFDFSSSPFKRVPTAQKQISNVLEDAYGLSGDAYEAHIFKKSIDEVINFSKNIEGLSAKAQKIIGQMRTVVDDGLDSTFDNYKVANDEFRKVAKVREVMDSAFGDVVDETKASTLLRRVFSQSAKRGEISTAISQLEKVLKDNGIKVSDDLKTQTKFAELLESIFGTQAVTSLKGQVESGVRGAAKGLNLIKNPIGGTIDLAGDLAEKVFSKDDQARIDFLKKFFELK